MGASRGGGRRSWRVSTLFRRALAARTEDAEWACIQELRERGDLRVFERASVLLAEGGPRERRLGADVLGQIRLPEGVRDDRVLRVLLRALGREGDPEVLEAVLVAVGHARDFDDTVGTLLVTRHRDHESADVRRAVVLALLGHDHRESLAALIRLSRDPEVRVRDWATFGLGAQTDADTARLRDALWDRTDDPDLDTRCEAICGLARRRDPRIAPVLRRALAGADPTSLLFEAAEELGDPDILPLLREIRERAVVDDGVDPGWMFTLEGAIDRLETGSDIPTAVKRAARRSP